MRTFCQTLFLLSFLLLTIQPSLLKAQPSNTLAIVDPQFSWRWEQGTIEESFISVEPKGLYTEIGFYLTLSARATNYSPGTQLEIVLNFNLPLGAIVHDSWLWVEDDIIRGKILDRWTASRIYENIVNRRRDPSILVKNSSTAYQLRIYPLIAGQSRKVKISYLVPNKWREQKITAALPTGILQYSRLPYYRSNLLIWDSPVFKNMRLEGVSLPFIEGQDSVKGGSFKITNLPWQNLSELTGISFDAPLSNGIFLNQFKDGDDGYYQLAVYPHFLFDKRPPKKVTILIDHEAANSTISGPLLLKHLKKVMQEELSETDSFNLVFSSLLAKPFSNTWLPADSLTIENTFQQLGTNPVRDYSNLPGLLSAGIDFIQKNGDDGSILLLSSSSQLLDFQVANSLLDDVLELLDPIIPVSILSFKNQSYRSKWVNGRYFYDNDYFYENLARQTSGQYITLRSNPTPFQDLLANLFPYLEKAISEFDLHTGVSDGFCYSRYNLNNINTVYPNVPLLQVGKFQGGFPFTIEMAGNVNGVVRSRNLTVNSANIFNADSLSVEAWAGNYVYSLETANQTNANISAAIHASLSERVLSLYTAFLCLEPAQGGEPCLNCYDETIQTGVDEAAKDSVQIVVAPNPFVDFVQIEISLPESMRADEIQIDIFNLSGQPVKSFEKTAFANGKILLTWDGETANGGAAATGMYILKVQTPAGNKMVKLLKSER